MEGESNYEKEGRTHPPLQSENDGHAGNGEGGEIQGPSLAPLLAQRNLDSFEENHGISLANLHKTNFLRLATRVLTKALFLC